MTDIIVHVQRPPQLECLGCGVVIDAGCDCGLPYRTAGERAAEAIADNPEKSDRAIAADIGVSHPTVAKVRKATGKSFPVKRVGRDGKARAVPAPRRAIPRAIRVAEEIRGLLDAQLQFAVLDVAEANDPVGGKAVRHQLCMLVKRAELLISKFPVEPPTKAQRPK